MKQNKKGLVLLVVASALLAACNDEQVVERNTDPSPIPSVMGWPVALEIGGLALADALLADLARIGDLPAATYCTSGSRVDTIVAGDDYPTHSLFTNCQIGKLTLNGSADFHGTGNAEDGQWGVRFNDLQVDGLFTEDDILTGIPKGALSMVVSGMVESSHDSALLEDRLDVTNLSFKGSTTRYGSTALVSLEVPEYSRLRTAIPAADPEDGGTRTLQVSGHLIKAGDYGTYDVDLTNAAADANADCAAAPLEGPYTEDFVKDTINFASGKLCIRDHLKAGSLLVLSPTEAVPPDPDATPADGEENNGLPAGALVQLTGHIDTVTFNVAHKWEEMKPLFIISALDGLVPPH